MDRMDFFSKKSFIIIIKNFGSQQIHYSRNVVEVVFGGPGPSTKHQSSATEGSSVSYQNGPQAT